MTDFARLALTIAVPREFAFRSLTNVEGDSPLWRRGRPPRVLARRPGLVTVELHRRIGGRAMTVVERVRLQPPERLDADLVEGPLDDLRESVVLTALDAATTRLAYTGDLSLGAGRIGRAIERFVVVPVHNREMRDSLRRLRIVLEAAARASGVVDG